MRNLAHLQENLSIAHVAGPREIPTLRMVHPMRLTLVAELRTIECSRRGRPIRSTPHHPFPFPRSPRADGSASCCLRSRSECLRPFCDSVDPRIGPPPGGPTGQSGCQLGPGKPRHPGSTPAAGLSILRPANRTPSRSRPAFAWQVNKAREYCCDSLVGELRQGQEAARWRFVEDDVLLRRRRGGETSPLASFGNAARG